MKIRSNIYQKAGVIMAITIKKIIHVLLGIYILVVAFQHIVEPAELQHRVIH